MKTKKCSKCKQTFPTSGFYLERKKGKKVRLVSDCKKCANKSSLDRYYKRKQENPKLEREKQRNWHRKWANNNPQRVKELQRRYSTKLRNEVLNHYGDGDPHCVCCGESEFMFLAIDHIGGGGTQHRKNIRYGNIYFWLRKKGYPNGFQILCHNCNFAKGAYRKCPHQTYD
jgi:hypothetical protein